MQKENKKLVAVNIDSCSINFLEIFFGVSPIGGPVKPIVKP